MLETFRNAWKVEDLRKKIIYTLIMLLIYRVGSVIPTPGVNVDYIAQQVNNISMLGMLMPTFTICALAAVFFQKFKDSKVLKDIMLGVRPTALGIIFAVMITLSLTNYTLGGAFSLRALAVGILALVLLTKGKWSVPKVIVLSALLGLLI